MLLSPETEFDRKKNEKQKYKIQAQIKENKGKRQTAMANEINLLILEILWNKITYFKKNKMKFCEMDIINLLNEWYSFWLGLVAL